MGTTGFLCLFLQICFVSGVPTCMGVHMSHHHWEGLVQWHLLMYVRASRKMHRDWTGEQKGGGGTGRAVICSQGTDRDREKQDRQAIPVVTVAAGTWGLQDMQVACLPWEFTSGGV